MGSSTYIALIFIALFVALLIFASNGKNILNNLSVHNFSENENTNIQTNNSNIVQGCDTCTIVNTYTTNVPSTTGTKRAVLFGLNYNFPGSVCLSQGCVLQGCIDDVNNIRSFLLTQGYRNENIKLYTDMNTYNTPLFPTKAFMKQQITTLVQNTQAGDSAFIWYSGHGSQIRINNGYRECWCPPDTLANGQYLTDIELHQLVSPLVKDSKLFIGSDSCHSGTVFDLSYFLAEPNQTNVRTLINNKQKTINSNLSGQSISRNIIPITRSLVDMVLVDDSQNLKIAGLVIALSGCQNADTSADAYENGSFQGAMTWSFLTNVNALINDNGSLQDLLRAMRVTLSNNGYSQVPQIEISLDIDPKTFIKDIFK